MESEPATRYKAFVRPRSHAVITAICILATVVLYWRYVASGITSPDHVFVTTPEVQIGWLPLTILVYLANGWGREAVEERQRTMNAPTQRD